MAERTEYLDEAATAQMLGVSRRTLQRWRDTGEGVVYVRLGVRRVAYSARDIAVWTAARTFTNRAAELAGQAKVLN